MSIKEIKVNKFAKSNEVSTNQQQQIVDQKLITLTGIATSRIQQALKAKKTNGLFPYPARAFLKVVQECIDCENTKTLCQTLQPKHKTCEECAKQKCRACEIPVFFRIKENNQWIKPKIKTVSHLQVQGYFDNPLNIKRKITELNHLKIIKRKSITPIGILLRKTREK